MKHFRLAVVCAVGLGATGLVPGAQATVLSLPAIQVVVGQGDTKETFDFKLSETANGWGSDQTLEKAGEWSIRLNGSLDQDPSIAYGIAVVDFGAPSSFSFLFFTPIVPTGPSVAVNSSLVGTVTDFTGDGVSITPSGSLVQSSALSSPATSMGVDVGPAFSGGPGPAGALYVYGPYSAGPVAGPSGIWTGLSITVEFGLSGGGDTATLSGFAEVVEAREIPDSGPGALGLICCGLMLAGGALLRRRERAV